MINSKINFDQYGEITRQNYQLFPSVPLKEGKFSEASYKIRKNTFFSIDHWRPFQSGSTKKFYDILSTTTEIFDVSKTYPKIAQLNFRLNSDKQNHTRVVFSFYDWLGSVGGVLFVVKSGVAWAIGGYLSFSMQIQLIEELKKIYDTIQIGINDSHHNNHIHDE